MGKAHLLPTSATVLAAQVTIRWLGETALAILWLVANRLPEEESPIHPQPWGGVAIHKGRSRPSTRGGVTIHKGRSCPFISTSGESISLCKAF